MPTRASPVDAEFHGNRPPRRRDGGPRPLHRFAEYPRDRGLRVERPDQTGSEHPGQEDE